MVSEVGGGEAGGGVVSEVGRHQGLGAVSNAEDGQRGPAGPAGTGREAVHTDTHGAWGAAPFPHSDRGGVRSPCGHLCDSVTSGRPAHSRVVPGKMGSCKFTSLSQPVRLWYLCETLRLRHPVTLCKLNTVQTHLALNATLLLLRK